MSDSNTHYLYLAPKSFSDFRNNITVLSDTVTVVFRNSAVDAALLERSESVTLLDELQNPDENESRVRWLKESYLSSGNKIGGFKGSELLGEGQSGIIRLVKPSWPEGAILSSDSFVLKFLNAKDSTPSIDFKRRKHLINEARILLALNHPNLIRIYGIEPDSEKLFLIMENLEATSLLEKLKNLSEKEMISLAIKILRVLKYFHQLEIVHRDIKPGNILITPEGEPILIDFGLAKVGEFQRKRGHIYGSPSYMAPEALTSDEKIDHRSDLYSFGALLYHYFIGESPYSFLEHTTQKQVFETIIRAPIFSEDYGAKQDLDALSPRRRDLLAKALSLKKDDRFQDADQFIEALKKYAKAEGIEINEEEAGFSQDRIEERDRKELRFHTAKKQDKPLSYTEVLVALGDVFKKKWQEALKVSEVDSEIEKIVPLFFKKAKTLYEKALSLEPESSEAKKHLEELIRFKKDLKPSGSNETTRLRTSSKTHFHSWFHSALDDLKRPFAIEESL